MKNRREHRKPLSRTTVGLLVVSVVVLCMALPPAVAQTSVPDFSKAFSPSTIGSGSASTLTFTIDNSGGVKVTDLAFSDTLPAGMTIATPANAATSCVGGVLSAPDGGTTISLSGGRVGTANSCTVTVNVTATTTATNTSGDLTSSGGNSGTAMATLTVDGARPGFSKSFSPSSIPLGGTSTLTFTIDNSAGGSFAQVSFNDPLPAGMVIASPSNAASDCTSGLPAAGADEEDTIFFGGVVLASTTCTASIDVTTNITGRFVNVSSELQVGTSNPVSSGVATAVLDVPVDFLSKSFTDDPVAPGGSVTLEFTITNPDRVDSATNITFTDDLSFLTGLTAAGLPLSACGGTLAGSAGDTFLTFSGGTLAPEASCSFSVTLSVPASAGDFTNTTGAITATIDGVGVVGNTATDVLSVSPIPTLTKEFLDATTGLPGPLGAGDSVKLEFTITNTSPTSTATDITFVDVFDADVLQTATSLPVNGVFCGASSTATFTPLFNPPQDATFPARLVIAGAELAAGGLVYFRHHSRRPGRRR